METIKAVAPAKVNLLLAIGERQPDGYHKATTVMHALAMHDTLEVSLVERGEHVQLLEPGDAAQPLRQVELEAAPDSGLAVSANTLWSAGLDPIVIPDEDNLACRAVHLLANATDRNEDEHVRLVIRKEIPHQTGLGGGSTDAAAALVAAANLWGIPLESPVLAECAKQLGADVAFFLRGGCALLQGRGDEYDHALPARKEPVVVVKPAQGVSTAQAYALFDDSPVPTEDSTLADAHAAAHAAEVPLHNNLAPAAEVLLPELADIRTFALEQPGVRAALLCGSGSGTFCICEDFSTAHQLVSAATRAGWWARATSFAPWGASLLP